MKIAQITHYGSLSNYGALLQAYALQLALKELGHDAFLLQASFSFHNILRKWYKSPLRVLKAWRRNRAEQRAEQLHPRKFREFAASRMTLSAKKYFSHRDLLKDPIDADALVTGSDQVWSGKTPFPPYFLDFGAPEAIRFSYAASIGSKARTDAEYLQKFRQSLTKFSGVSVREFEALEQCHLAGIDSAVLVPDPVMLFDGDHYRKELQLTAPQTSGKYCLIYTVGRKLACEAEIVAYCRQKNLQIIVVAAQHQNNPDIPGGELCYPEIQEFLALIDHAEMVVTDSFHGTVFSLLFNTPVTVIPKNDHDARFDTLNEYFHISGAYCRGDFEQATEYRFDFPAVNRKIAALQTVGWDFLKSVTGGGEK